MYSVVWIFLYCFSCSTAWPFSDQNDNFSNYSKMKVGLSGFMVAFGDFNADRATDIFILDTINGVQHLDVILMTKDSQKSATRIPLLQDPDSSIVGVVAGDFDGDNILDLVIYRGKLGAFRAEVAYGLNNSIGISPPIIIANGTLFATQPLHLDWNADMFGDLFCQLQNKSFVVLLGQKSKSFSLVSSDIKANMENVAYSKFLDMDNNGQADILLIGRSQGRLAMTSLVKNAMGQFVNDRTYVGDNMPGLMGQGVVGDYQLVGDVSMLVPVCRDKVCANSYLVLCLLRNMTCADVTGSMDLNGNRMQFVPGSNVAKLSLALPELVPMSCGDLHLTGYIECLVIMAPVNDPTTRTVVIIKRNANMTYSVKAVEGVAALYTNVSQLAIFDLEEDGIPDIITVKQVGQSGLITPLLHESSNDQYFIKVLVLNGLCSNPDDCRGGKLPYGIPLPGVSVSYSTESASGGTQSAMAAICPDSDYTSLQLPYTYFGLGAFANYVEKLYIKLPSASVPRQHILSFIVPKTQIVVIPYPLDDPSKWTNKLFLEPFHNRKVIFVAAALLGSFLIVTIIACILQYLEVRVDRLEKMQEAQKFHFDAM